MTSRTREFPARPSINPSSTDVWRVSSSLPYCWYLLVSKTMIVTKISFEGKNLALGHLEDMQCDK